VVLGHGRRVDDDDLLHVVHVVGGLGGGGGERPGKGEEQMRLMVVMAMTLYYLSVFVQVERE